MIECTSEFRSLDPDEPTNPVDRLVTENENLRRKLQTLPVIEQAKGILMGRYGIPADDAFEMLRRWSQHTNTKLHLVAQTIINNRCPAEASDRTTHRDPASTPTAHPQGRETSASDGHSWLSPHPAAATDTKEQFASHPWAPCRTSNR
jgi:hypothetical protein